MADVIQPREQAYLDLLHRGLVKVRDFAWDGQMELCRIEADHLHNIPTLLGETNEHRWNCAHIANAVLRPSIEAVCRHNGHEPPVICTPEQLLKE